MTVPDLTRRSTAPSAPASAEPRTVSPGLGGPLPAPDVPLGKTASPGLVSGPPGLTVLRELHPELSDEDVRLLHTYRSGKLEADARIAQVEADLRQLPFRQRARYQVRVGKAIRIIRESNRLLEEELRRRGIEP